MDEHSRRPNLENRHVGHCRFPAFRPTALVLSEDLVQHHGEADLSPLQSALPFAGKYRLIDFAPPTA